MTPQALFKSWLPRPMLLSLRQLRMKYGFREYRNLSTQQVFSKIYKEGRWGNSGDLSRPFFSGDGSTDSAVVSAYIQVTREFLASFETPPDVVDLGCGDFFVGSRIRDLCGTYTACDVVPELIAFNRKAYAGLDVDFRVLDLSTEALPKGQVVFIRQVLQHLSNEQILNAMPDLQSKYDHIVLTEHLPMEALVHPNRDIRVGHEIRMGLESGVDLTCPPFNLKPLDQRRVCQVIDSEGLGLISTVIYRMTDLDSAHASAELRYARSQGEAKDSRSMGSD